MSILSKLLGGDEMKKFQEEHFCLKCGGKVAVFQPYASPIMCVCLSEACEFFGVPRIDIDNKIVVKVRK